MANVKKKEKGLDKYEKSAKDFIELGFKPHKGSWYSTSKRLLDAYKGKYYDKPSKRRRFTINTFFSLVNLLLPNLIFTQPYIRAIPRNAKYTKKLLNGDIKVIDNIYAAQVREASINHKYSQLDGIGEQRKALQDSFFYSFGITKVGYSFDTMTQDDKDYALRDSPFLKRVDPNNFGWHPLATGVDDSTYLVHRILTTKERLKQSGDFEDVEELIAEIPQHLKDRVKDISEIKEENYVSLYEVHDQERDTIYTYAGESRKLISKKKNPYKFRGSHFQMIKLAGDNDDFIGIPLLAMVEDEAIALNEIATLIVEHFKKYPAIMVYESGAIDKDDIERIRNNEQGAMHQVANIDKVKFQNPLAMGQEYFGIVSLLQNLIDRILGVPDFQRMTSTTRKSATEASFIQGDATVRREYYLQLVKAFMLDGIKKVGALQAQFQDEDEEIQAMGELRGLSFKYNKSDIQGDWQFDFDVETLRASNEAQLNNLNNLLQIMAGNEVLHPYLKAKDPVKLGDFLFKKAGLNGPSFDFGSAESSLFPTPEKENEMARSNQPMPAPKKGEDYKHHVEVHTMDLKTKGPNEAILDHLASTVILMQREEQSKVLPASAQPDVPPAMSQPEMMQPEGPQGPLQGV